MGFLSHFFRFQEAKGDAAFLEEDCKGCQTRSCLWTGIGVMRIARRTMTMTTFTSRTATPTLNWTQS